MYAYVPDNQTVESVGRLPSAARRLDTQEWVLFVATTPVDTLHACGWYAVTEVVRPADDATTTYDLSYMFDGTTTVTQTWTARPKTQVELDADTAAAAQDTRATDLTTAVATLRQWASDAASTTVTSGNAVAVLGTVVTRLGIFFDRFADLLEYQGL